VKEIAGHTRIPSPAGRGILSLFTKERPEILKHLRFDRYYAKTDVISTDRKHIGV
jgi:hypothetical protein